MQILDMSTFFAMLLYHLGFAVDTACPTACTDGERIYFGEEFCDNLSTDELTVVMLHELMHVVLGHCWRAKGYNPLLYNIAADIVVNSTIMDTLGLDITVAGEELMHLAPDGTEGHLHTAEEIYEMLLNTLPKRAKKPSNGGVGSGSGSGTGAGKSKGQSKDGNEENQSQDQDEDDQGKGKGKSKGKGGKDGRNGQGASSDSDDGGSDGEDSEYDTSAYDSGRLDDHSAWHEIAPHVKGEWQSHIVDAARTAVAQGKAAGSAAELAERLLKELTHPTINWRLLLQNFIQSEIHDYSFTPPDKRYDDFFLPDFNEPDDVVRDLWIAMDTSGSISNADMVRAFSEIKGGIEQFGGKLQGKLSFFDAMVTPPVEFETVEELVRIRPRGGGGTSFHAVFDYYRKHLMHADTVSGIIIITDGYAVFPPESAAAGVPVFWLINNKIVTPPWGVVARFLPEPK